ncbi:MAG: hypothetical protein FWD17_07190 [Polyangiaceae bacterium]|nr:hypothetical protein [Polyangiaceae bacterium]
MKLVEFVKAGAGVVSVALVLGGCGSTKASQPAEPTQSSLSFAINDPTPSFSGNSVRICGARGALAAGPNPGVAPGSFTPAPADGKYRCFSDLNQVFGSFDPTTRDNLNAAEESSPCPCFQFADGSAGALQSVVTAFPSGGEGLMTAPLPTTQSADGTSIPVLDNLCPSADLSAGGSAGAQWSFSYAIYTDDACGANGGALLNDAANANNFVCHAASDLVTVANPNMTANEALNPGLNTNNVICSTINAQKSFDFQSCALTCFTSAGAIDRPLANGTCPVLDTSTLDCGCTLTGEGAPAVTNDACVCGGTPVSGLGLDLGNCNAGPLPPPENGCGIFCGGNFRGLAVLRELVAAGFTGCAVPAVADFPSESRPNECTGCPALGSSAPITAVTSATCVTTVVNDNGEGEPCAFQCQTLPPPAPPVPEASAAQVAAQLQVAANRAGSFPIATAFNGFANSCVAAVFDTGDGTLSSPFNINCACTPAEAGTGAGTALVTVGVETFSCNTAGTTGPDSASCPVSCALLEPGIPSSNAQITAAIDAAFQNGFDCETNGGTGGPTLLDGVGSFAEPFVFACGNACPEIPIAATQVTVSETNDTFICNQPTTACTASCYLLSQAP